MRITNSLKNITLGVLSQLVIVLLGFISRKVFLDSLGVEYLGVNGLLTNVLSMLALIEAGIGVSIVYCLYKPLAENDKPKIIALIQLYKKAYSILAFLILGLSVLLYPLMGMLIKESGNIPNVTLAYFLFVLKNMVTYLNAHKVSLINADQKGYILARINLLFQIITSLAKIFILIVTENYIIYLTIELLLYIVQTLYNGNIVSKRYSYIKTKKKYYIEQYEKEKLIQNIKALFLHNIGSFFVFGTDNILISAFVGIVTVGLYSNYTMILGQLNALISPILGGIGASIGNLIAIESKEKSYSIFKVAYLINFWIYSISVIFLYNLLEPFLNWWLGKGFLLDSLTYCVILINFYITGLRSSISTFKVKAGIFVQDKYIPLLEALINLIASVVLVQVLGLAGIFIGTLISTLSCVFWNVPRLVYKHVFKKPVWSYFVTYFYFILLTIISGTMTTLLCNFLILGESLYSLIFKGLVCFMVPNIFYLIIFYRNKEFNYIKSIIIHNLSLKLKLKFSSAS